MELNSFFKSIVDQCESQIVICDLNHTIIYINPKAREDYSKRQVELVGKSIFDCHNADSQNKIKKVIEYFSQDVSHNVVHTFFNEKQNKDVYMVALRDENQKLIGYYERQRFRTKDSSPFYQL